MIFLFAMMSTSTVFFCALMQKPRDFKTFKPGCVELRVMVRAQSANSSGIGSQQTSLLHKQSPQDVCFWVEFIKKKCAGSKIFTNSNRADHARLNGGGGTYIGLLISAQFDARLRPQFNGLRIGAFCGLGLSPLAILSANAGLV